jgi:hypothetical protein
MDGFNAGSDFVKPGREGGVCSRKHYFWQPYIILPENETRV